MIAPCETPEETQEVISKINDAYYRGKYYLCETSKDENGKLMTVYFRKYCPGLLAARLKEEGKTQEEIAEAVREEEGDPAFTTDAKYAKLFESMEEADSHMQHLNYRCKTRLEVRPAFLLNHKASKRFLDSLLKEKEEGI